MFTNFQDARVSNGGEVIKMTIVVNRLYYSLTELWRLDGGWDRRGCGSA